MAGGGDENDENTNYNLVGKKDLNDGSPGLWDFTGGIWVVFFFFTILCFLAHSGILDLSYLLLPCMRVVWF